MVCLKHRQSKLIPACERHNLSCMKCVEYRLHHAITAESEALVSVIYSQHGYSTYRTDLLHDETLGGSFSMHGASWDIPVQCFVKQYRCTLSSFVFNYCGGWY